MSLDKILTSTRKLNNMGRWATEFMHQRPTVAEHSFTVAQICQMLGLIEENNGSTIDWGRLLKKAINHDVAESLTGDIISVIKHRTEEMKQMVEVIERQVVEETLLEPLEEPYKALYRELLFDGKDNTLEGQILSAADKIDALFECINEIRLANYHPYTEKYFEMIDKLWEMNMVSVQYFLENILPNVVVGIEALQK